MKPLRPYWWPASWWPLCSWRYGSVIALVLAGCVSAPPRRTPPPPVTPTPPSAVTVLPTNPPNVNDIPDAVPRFEPRSPYGNPPFYVVAGHRYAVLPSSNGYVERGVASWYGTEFHGLKTSTGEPYDMFAMTAAHKTLPLPCYARVTNLSNGKSAVVRINDRGPFVSNRIIDLSYSAARKLDMIRNGTAFVQVEVLTPAAPNLRAQLPVSVPAVSASVIGASSAPPITIDPSTPPAAAAPDTPAPGSAAPVTPISTPPTAPPPPAATPSSIFYIQVGAYSRAENARSVAGKLRADGFDHVITLASSQTQPLQRVRIGPIVSVQQFDATISKLSALGYPNARLAQD